MLQVCEEFVQTRGQISSEDHNKILVKTLNVARRVLKNILQKPDERKYKILKKKIPLLKETIF